MSSVIRRVFRALVDGFNGLPLSSGQLLQSSTRKPEGLPNLLWRTGGWNEDNWLPPFVYRIDWDVPCVLTVQGEPGDPTEIQQALEDLDEWAGIIYGLPLDSRGFLVTDESRRIELEHAGKLYSIAQRFVGPYLKRVQVRPSEADDGFAVADCLVHVEFLVDNTPTSERRAMIFTVGAQPFGINVALQTGALGGSDYSVPLADDEDVRSQTVYAKPETLLRIGDQEVRGGFPPLVPDLPRVEGELDPVKELLLSGPTSVIVASTVQLTAIAIHVSGATELIGGLGLWNTDKAVVATVSDGVVTGVALGNANISVSYGGLQASQNVIVKAIIVRRTISQPTDGSDFRVTLPSAQPNDTYAVIPCGVVKGSSTVQVDCPDDAAGDRTTTDFRVVTTAPLSNGDILEFVVVPS